MSRDRVLLVQLPPASIQTLKNEFPPDESYAVEVRESVRSALDATRDQLPAFIVLGLASGETELSGLRRLRGACPSVPLLAVSSANPSPDLGIRAIREGACDLMAAPLAEGAVRQLFERVRARKSDRRWPDVETERRMPQEEHQLLGCSPAILEVGKKIGRVAPIDVTVLIGGESGSGKELVARSIHRNSRRSDRPFVAINCAAIPETLLESELFGHEKGAFTGAVERKIGKLQSASGGTVLLDEIGDMSLGKQKKILRVLEERVVQPVGSREEIPVDIRILAATHQKLWDLVSRGEFRADLYYRLSVVEVRVPPLRERKEDIRPLVDHFVETFCRRLGRPRLKVPREVYRRLRAYSWPGNVRELRNVVQSSVVFTRGGSLELPRKFSVPSPSGERNGQNGDGDGVRSPAELLGEFCKKGVSLESLERRYIWSVLREVGWHYKQAAQVLDIHRNTLRRKLRRYDLHRPD